MVRGSARSTPRCVRAVFATRRPAVFLDVRSLWLLAIRARTRLRLVSARRRWLAPVPPRPVGHAAAVRMDLDRARSLGLAHASLRTMGILVGGVVLDSWQSLGRRVGLVGVRPWLRELVSARMEQPSGVLVHQHQHFWRAALRAVACVDGGAAPSLQHRLRERQRCLRLPDRPARQADIRGPGYGARMAFCLARLGTHSRRRNAHADRLRSPPRHGEAVLFWC